MQDAASVPGDRSSSYWLDSLPASILIHWRWRPKRSGASLLRLALARGPGGFSLRQTAGWASLLDIAERSNPAVHYRLTQAADFLSVLLERLLAAKVAGANLRWVGRTRPPRGRHLYQHTR